MKNNISILKLVIAAFWLVSGLACGSQNQVGNNSTNVSAGNVNTVAAAPTVKPEPTPAPKKPEDVCAYLPEFPGGEYKSFSGDYRCKFEKEEKLPGGKRRSWTYEVIGATSYVKWVEFTFSSNGTTAENQQGEKRFVEQMKIFWQKAFAAPLPDRIRDELLFHKGKVATSEVDFKEPVRIEVRHVDAGNNIYVLKIRLVFYQMKNGLPSPGY